jgi:lipopolysaccharide/colanic/teichoic acid biosynthesis glycosyltransferase
MLETINLNGQFSKNFQRQKHDFIKRSVDIMLSYIGILCLAPLMGLIAVLIKCTSAGSIIFRQKRIGYDGREFEVLKFRTMFADADEKIHEVYIKKLIEENSVQQHPESSSFKVPNDHRITPVGRFLRNTCLDELPQLINVFKGEMSLVGPRPHPIYEVSYYKEWFHRRLNVKPGLTGLWQIQGKKSMRYSDAIRLDLSYIDKRSLGLDLKILLFTLPTPLAGLRSH